jgi:prepilin-type N-terminal cleavage/methylation domain-containing protein
VLKRKSAGYSLVELMVAMGIIAVVSAPIFMLYQFGTRMAATAHRQTIAAILAQQRIEELIGLPLDELEDAYANEAAYPYNAANNYFYVALKGDAPTPAYLDDFDEFAGEGFLNKLAEVTVLVYDSKEVADNAFALNYATGAIAPVAEQTVVISLAEEP